MIPTFDLRDGYQIPQIGFGTWQLAEYDTCYNCVRAAIDAGYTSIDTATAYGNEQAVGDAIRDSGVAREKLLITTKLNNPQRGYESTLRAFDDSMKWLGLDYLDLYLIHWPGTPELFLPTWKAFLKLQEEGRIRSVGVSNFLRHHLETLIAEYGVIPAVDQIEAHPYLYQGETIDFCHENNIQIESWSPLMSGKEALQNPVLADIATQCGKDVGQVILRWHVQNGRRPLPRSTKAARIKSNLDIFDFTLTAEQMAAIDALRVNNKRSGPHPDEFALTND